MADLDPTDPRVLATAIMMETRRQLLWLRESGVKSFREESIAPLAAPSTEKQVGAPSAKVEHAAPRPPAPVVPLFKPTAAKTPETALSDHAAALKAIRDDLGDCKRCGLCTTRTNIVFGQGNPNAEIVFLGEGPGEDEDKSGLAFVGKAGQLLTKMIEAMGLTRDDVYICNIVKCRPPGNRKPEPVEVDSCRPFVERQIHAIKPKVIVALGATAAQSLLRTETPIGRLRNQWTEWEGIAVMPTFHPSYLLRDPNQKGKAWDDLKLVLAKLGRELPKRS